MGIPVKLKVDGFTHMGESFDKGEVFDAPHEAMASYLCDQEKQATRVDESKLEPAKVGTMKRVMKGGYDTKVMSPDNSGGKPTVTKNSKKGGNKKVKADANAPANNTKPYKCVGY